MPYCYAYGSVTGSSQDMLRQMGTNTNLRLARTPMQDVKFIGKIWSNQLLQGKLKLLLLLMLL